MNKKQSYKLSIIIFTSLCLIPLFYLYLLYWEEITQSLAQIEGMWLLTMIILVRIAFITAMTLYMYHRWFKQEELYLSDIPLLFGSFLLFLIFGKILDLFWDLTFFSFDEEFVMILLKIRFLIIILEMAPLVYLSINMILYLRSLSGKSTGDEKQRNKSTFRIMVMIVAIEIIAVILAPNFTIMGILLPFIVIPSIVVIIWMFLFAYKNKRLSQVHPLIIAIGFIAWLISNIMRPLLQTIFGETTTYVIYAEIIDFFVFIIIFLGFCFKAKYPED
ncbi:MAG: hypothetical protein ACFFAS_20810 [Promethearchaeota archaeon]